jgi:hypothetical protein
MRLVVGNNDDERDHHTTIDLTEKTTHHHGGKRGHFYPNIKTCFVVVLLVASLIYNTRHCPMDMILISSSIDIEEKVEILPKEYIVPSETESFVVIEHSEDLASKSSSSLQVEVLPKEYIPSRIESFVIKHSEDLGYKTKTIFFGSESEKSSGCNLWTRDERKMNQHQTLKVPDDIYNSLQEYLVNLDKYKSLVDSFQAPVKDIRLAMGNENSKDICKSLRLHPNGLAGIFDSSSVDGTISNNILSFTPQSGFIEPLLTPLRHPKICFRYKRNLLNMGYLIHDFEHMCRNSIHRTSRTVLIDMGASLTFHGSSRDIQKTPAIYLTSIYEKFGIVFDHIYAYEIRNKSPDEVFKLVPDNLRSAYHWINIGVSAKKGSHANPLTMLLDSFNKNDFIVIKLDIDTAPIEVPLAKQLMENPNVFNGLVDAFYFEHHVALKELSSDWGRSTSGSVHDSLDLFTKLRQSGIPAHSWV